MPITRRAVLKTVGAIAGTVIASPSRAEDAPRIKLRLLETSDLHAFILGWDYYRARPDPTVGFAAVASLIRSARAEVSNTLLFDNGDFLQGNPLADFIAEQASRSAFAPHPVIAGMTALEYDAIGLGNHEFNYGVNFLESTIAGASCPVVCANVTRAGGTPFLPPYAIVERSVKDVTGIVHTLRIGVIGFVPPQILIWDKGRLDGKLEATDIVLTARRLIPELRARCDILVALCHSGIRTGDYIEGQENAAFHLAAVPGIDVIMTGHSHRVFPGPDYAGLEGVDAAIGRLQGVPAVMPGFWGSHLGVVDLTLNRSSDGWIVEKADVQCRPIARRIQGKVEALASPDAVVTTLIGPAHAATLAWVDQPIGKTDAPVHSYFVWTGYDPATALVNAAQAWYARPLLATSAYAGLPLLSSVAPFRAGYTADSFIDIAAGRTTLRDIAELYIYSNNTVVLVKVTGAQILEWLEFSARVFNTIDPRVGLSGPQPLVDKRVPSFNFDIISGLTYKIDVTKPARYDGRNPNPGDWRRIVDVRYDGQPIDPAREFLVVTNNHRADGGGGFPGFSQSAIILRAPDTNRDALVAYFKAHTTVAVPKDFPWSFATTGRTASVYFDTGRSAHAHLSSVPGLKLLGDGEPGYSRIGFELS